MKPIQDGGGAGNHRRFTPMQAVAIALGYSIYRSEFGCALSFVAKVVGCYSVLTEEDLCREFDKGNTHLILADHLPLGPPRYADIEGRSAKAAYDRVNMRILAIERRLKLKHHKTGGRRRGLAKGAKPR